MKRCYSKVKTDLVEQHFLLGIYDRMLVDLTNASYVLYYLYTVPSVLEQSPSSTIATENSKITLHCNATGNPPPNITWTKDGSNTVLYQGERFTISSISSGQAGLYVCTAWNGVRSKANASATVTVHCKSDKEDIRCSLRMHG